MQKEIEGYWGEISFLDEMSNSVKVKTGKARKIKRKRAITSIDNISIIKTNPSAQSASAVEYTDSISTEG